MRAVPWVSSQRHAPAAILNAERQRVPLNGSHRSSRNLPVVLPCPGAPEYRAIRTLGFSLFS
jgi:hypothetical protein